MRIRLGIVLSSIAVAVAPLVFTAPAQAQSTGVTDATDDVWHSGYRNFGWWNPDLAGVQISHTSKRLIATARFHRVSELYDVLEVRIDTDGDPAAEARFADQPVFGNRGVFRGAGGEKMLCGATLTYDRANKLVRMSAPRSCFGNPRLVRARAIYFEQLSDGDWVIDDTRWTAKVNKQPMP